jgi:hypothetical protein
VRLHSQYGNGLKNIYNPKTKEFNFEEFHKGPKAKHLAAQKKRLGQMPLPGETQNTGVVSIGGVEIDTTVGTAFLLGWTAGLQYQPDFAGPCFLTVTDTVNSLNYFVTDWNNFWTTYNWYNLAILEPMHFYSNLMATYE